MSESMPLEDRDPGLAKRVRSRLRDVASGILAAAVVLTMISAFIAWKIPFSRDLYNLAYTNQRPYKGEDTYMFLFIFPAFLWGLGVLLWFDPGSLLRRRCTDDNMLIWACVWNALGAAIFAVAALSRDMAAWHHYF